MNLVSHDLEEFVNFLNNGVGTLDKIPNVFNVDTFKSYGDAIQQSFERHFTQQREDDGNVLRASNLGKPAAVLALNKLGYKQPEPVGKSRFIFHFGDFFENWLEIMLRSQGIKILSSQGEVEWNGIKGHYDYVVEVDGEAVLLEAKTMGTGYAKQFMRQANDNRGYITQLAIYRAATNLKSAWICFDKGTNEIFLVDPDYEQFDAALGRAEKVVERMQRVTELRDVLKLFQAPPPYPEVYRGQETGNYLIPQSMAYSPFKYALYNVTSDYNGYNKLTEYANEYATYSDMKDSLEELVYNGAVLYSG